MTQNEIGRATFRPPIPNMSSDVGGETHDSSIKKCGNSYSPTFRAVHETEQENVAYISHGSHVILFRL
jgi:hypothetical protein